MQARRHQYLNAMGIQVWQLRDSLPGAKPVVEPELDSAAVVDQPFQAESVSLDDSSHSEEVSAVPAVVEEKTSTATENLQPPVTPRPENLEAEQPASVLATTVESNPEFRLASIIFPNSCMVVTQVPTQGAEPLTSKHLGFLKNVLSALGAKLFDEPMVTFFNWPMLRSPGFDQGELAARQASQAFLNGQKSKHQVSFVLLMGEDTGRYLLPNFASFSESQGRLFSETDQPRLLSYSIDELFADSALKAAFWHDTQPLRLCLGPA